jgi:hypothetical protein
MMDIAIIATDLALYFKLVSLSFNTKNNRVYNSNCHTSY